MVWVFASMLKMKGSNFTSGGLMVGVFVSMLKMKGSNFTNGVFMVNNDKLIVYSLM